MFPTAAAQLSKFVTEFLEGMTTPAHRKLAEEATHHGRSVQGLLTDTPEGLKKACELAMKSETSLVSEYNGYRVIIANPVNAFVSTVGPGGIVVSDGENSICFDPTTGVLRTDGVVHARGTCYWDLGERDEVDEVFIVPIEE